VSRPQVIDDQERDRVHDRVAAVDVAKDTGMVCTRTPCPARSSDRTPGRCRALLLPPGARLAAGVTGDRGLQGPLTHGELQVHLYLRRMVAESHRALRCCYPSYDPTSRLCQNFTHL
jgi:hypothetical protein